MKLTIPEDIILIDLETEKRLPKGVFRGKAVPVKDEKGNQLSTDGELQFEDEDPVSFRSFFMLCIAPDSRVSADGDVQAAVWDWISALRGKKGGDEIDVEKDSAKKIEPLAKNAPSPRKFQCSKCGNGIDEGATTMFRQPPQIALQFEPFRKFMIKAAKEAS